MNLRKQTVLNQKKMERKIDKKWKQMFFFLVY